jgi:hypothetical protein
VVAFGEDYSPNDERYVGAIVVAPDSWGSEICPANSHVFGPLPDQLEPILPTPTAQDIHDMQGLPDFECPVFELLTLAKENH